MATQVSFSKYENDLLREFRSRINGAESSEDVKKVFDYAMRELFNRVFDGNVRLKKNDFAFSGDEESGSCNIHARLLKTEAFQEVWEDSDLSNIVDRFTEAANHRHIRLEKHREKNNLKIRP